MLFSSIWQYMVAKPKYTALMLGLDGSGKTSILQQLRSKFGYRSSGKFESVIRTRPTVGLNIGKFFLNGTELVLWDLGGQEGLRSIWDKYYADAMAVVFVVDADEPSRLPEARALLAALLHDQQLTHKPFLVLLNKKHAIDAEQQQQLLSMFSLPPDHLVPAAAQQRQFHVQFCNALKGDGLREALEWLIFYIPQRAA